MQPSTTKSSGPGRRNKRAQIVDAARRCFYERGITATGVDMIAAEAGVSKRTLYNHFPSKTDLVMAYIEWRDVLWRERLERHLDGVDDPIDRILVYFDAYFVTPDDEDFRGCALINAAAEIPDADDRVLALLQANKHRVQEEITDLVRDAGIAQPEGTGAALALLLEGSVALYGVHRDQTGVATAKEAARRVLGT